MKKQFERAGLSFTYPFGWPRYNEYQRKDAMHTDPVRLAWVRDRIRDMEGSHD